MKDEQNLQHFSYDEMFQKERNCPHEATAFRYFERSLTQQEAQQFDGHLKECEVCAALVAGLQESDLAVTSTILDSSQSDRVFINNRRKLQQRLEGTLEHPIPQKQFSFSPYLHGVIGVLIVALLVSLYGNYLLQHEVTDLADQLENQSKQLLPQKQTSTPRVTQKNQNLEPDVSASVIYPLRMERSSKPATIRLTFDESTKSRSLVFALPSIQYSQYLLKIKRDDQIIWQQLMDNGRFDPDSPLISIHLYSGFLAPGEYLLKVCGLKNGQETTIGEYAIVIR